MYLIALIEAMKVFVNHLVLTQRVTGKHLLLSLDQTKLSSTLELRLDQLKTLMSLQ
jgi:hypothetical protein